MDKIVILKKGKKLEQTLLYAIIPTSEEQIKEINRTKQLPEIILNRCISENLLNSQEDIKLVLHRGTLKLFTSYLNLVYEFPITRRQIADGKKQQYRDYSVPLENQKKMMHLVTLCSSPTISWNTALRASNSTFGIIVKIVKNE